MGLPKMPKISVQSLNAIDAIACGLLTSVSTFEGHTNAGEKASSAVIWSKEFEALTNADGRFPDSIMSPACNPNSDINRIDSDTAFAMGFNLALEIGARIALDPLGEHDIEAIMEPTKAKYLQLVRTRRDEMWNARRKEAVVL